MGNTNPIDVFLLLLLPQSTHRPYLSLRLQKAQSGEQFKKDGVFLKALIVFLEQL